MVKAVLAGSFDPITIGHIDLIKRSKKFCDQLVVAIGINVAKKTLFTEQERYSHLQRVVSQELDFLTGMEVQVSSFDGLLVEFARSEGAALLVRGVRSAADVDYEINLANVNKYLAPEIETILLPTTPDLSIISSSAVKEIARNKGKFESMVPGFVAQAIKEKLTPA